MGLWFWRRGELRRLRHRGLHLLFRWRGQRRQLRHAFLPAAGNYATVSARGCFAAADPDSQADERCPAAADRVPVAGEFGWRKWSSPPILQIPQGKGRARWVAEPVSQVAARGLQELVQGRNVYWDQPPQMKFGSFLDQTKKSFDLYPRLIRMAFWLLILVLIIVFILIMLIFLFYFIYIYHKYYLFIYINFLPKSTQNVYNLDFKPFKKPFLWFIFHSFLKCAKKIYFSLQFIISNFFSDQKS